MQLSCILCRVTHVTALQVRGSRPRAGSLGLADLTERPRANSNPMAPMRPGWLRPPSGLSMPGWRAPVAGWALAVLVLGPLLAIFHQASVRHTVCEHGDL